MNSIKDQANVCKACTCSDRLSAERVLFWLVHINHFFDFSINVQKHHMIQVASCEHALIKTNRKPIRNHQNKTMLLFKMYTLEFEFDRCLKHMVSYQGMQSGLPVCLASEFGIFEIFMQNDCSLVKPDFSHFSNYKHKNLGIVKKAAEKETPFRRFPYMFQSRETHFN